MAVGGNKYNILVTILEGRHFTPRPGCKLYMQCRFNGEILTTDPVDQTANPIWDTELPWELEARVIHYLRSQRATLKLECYSLTAQGRRDMQGFIMLDLRAAQEAPGQEKWMTLLNVGRGAHAGSSSSRPEIKMSFVVTGPHSSPPSTPGRKSVPVALRVPRLPVLERSAADSPAGAGGHWPGAAAGAAAERRQREPVGVALSPDGRYYKVGSATEGLHHYVLSITVAFAEHLDTLLDPEHPLLKEEEEEKEGEGGGPVDGYCFTFAFLGTDVATSRFPRLRDPSFPTEHVAIKFRSTPGDFARYLDEHEPVPVYLCHGTGPKLGRADITLGGVASLPSHVNEKMYPMVPCAGPHANPNCRANIGVSVEMAAGEENLADASLVLPVQRSAGGRQRAEQEHPQQQPPQPPVKMVGWHQYRFSIDLRSVTDLAAQSASIFLRYSYPPFGATAPVSTYPPVEVRRATETRLEHSFCAFEFVMSADRLKTYLDAVPLLVEVWDSARGGAYSKDSFVGVASVQLGPVLLQTTRAVDGSDPVVKGVTGRPDDDDDDDKVLMRTYETSAVCISEGDDGKLQKACEIRVILALEDFGEVEEPLAVAASVAKGAKRIESQLQPHEPPRKREPFETRAVAGDGGQQQDERTHPEPVDHHRHSGNSSGGTPATGSECTRGDSSLMTDGIRDTAEYRTAIQLEMWKQEEEDRFRKQLQKREAQLLSQLAVEWKRRDQEQSEMHRSKSEELLRLEDRTRTLLTDLEQREKRLVEGEEALQRRKMELAEEHARRLADAKDAARRLQEEVAQKLELERERTREAERQREQAAEELREYKRMHREMEREYAEFRKNLASTPEASLREAVARERELRAEAEARLEGCARSKRHYKAQWVRALQEFSKLRRRQQADFEERLRREHRELDELRLRYLTKEEQEIMASDRRALDDVRRELRDLKASSGGAAGPAAGDPGRAQPAPPPPPPPPSAVDTGHLEHKPALAAASQASLGKNDDARPPASARPAPSAYTTARPEPAPGAAPAAPALHPQVAGEIWRLEKEKQMLLRSGIYTAADSLVQDLDTKINHLRSETAA